MSSEIPMCLRIKRQNQTYFVMCTPNDTVEYLKQQVELASKQEWKAEQMRIIFPKDKSILNDSDMLKKYEDTIKNDSELYVVFQISEGEWESVHIEPTNQVLGGDGFDPSN